jgi:hypothetical protein
MKTPNTMGNKKIAPRIKKVSGNHHEIVSPAFFFFLKKGGAGVT